MFVRLRVLTCSRDGMRGVPGTDHYHKFAHGMDPGTYKDITHWATMNQLVMQQPAKGNTKVRVGLWVWACRSGLVRVCGYVAPGV